MHPVETAPGGRGLSKATLMVGWSMSEPGNQPQGGFEGGKLRWAERWASTPGVVRKTIVLIIGGSLIGLGVLLVVLPGPFTIPLLIAGFSVLGTEFAWAGSLLKASRQRAARVGGGLKRRLRR